MPKPFNRKKKGCDYFMGTRYCKRTGTHASLKDRIPNRRTLRYCWQHATDPLMKRLPKEEK